MANIILAKVRLFFACVKAEMPEDKLCTIIQPLHSIWMPAGIKTAFLLEEIWLYAQLTDGVGRFGLTVELHNEAGIRVGKSTPVPRDFMGGNQLDVEEILFPMTNVPFARPGMYEFKIVANHVELNDRGTSLLRVLPG